MFQPQPTPFATSGYFSPLPLDFRPPNATSNTTTTPRSKPTTTSSSCCSGPPPTPPSYGLQPNYVPALQLISPPGGGGAAAATAIATGGGAGVGAGVGVGAGTGAGAAIGPAPGLAIGLGGAAAGPGTGLEFVGAVAASHTNKGRRFGLARPQAAADSHPEHLLRQQQHHHQRSGPFPRPQLQLASTCHCERSLLLDRRQRQQQFLAVKMAEQNPHDMAAQQAAAKDYNPVLHGPEVGQKTPSDAITQEYAKADQAYVEKTIALPRTYSHYRPIQGDGNCGWRAIGFSYFEKLIEVGDAAQIENEIIRLSNYNQTLAADGGYNYFEDFADEMVDLLRAVISNLGDAAHAHQQLLKKWNDTGVASAIIYYLRLLAATYLKTHSVEYDPFIADSSGVHGYCSQSIELVNHEIEHLGIVALSRILLEPVNFVLEIAYLDRSPGSQVNTYRFPDEANQQPEETLGPIIYLLYRPTHYDILYREAQPQPIEEPIGPVSLQVHRVTGFTSNADITSTQSSLDAYSNMDMSLLGLLPGFGSGGPGPGPGLSLGCGPPVTTIPVRDSFPIAQQPQDPWASPFCNSSMEHASPQEVVAPPPQPTPQPVVTPATPANPPTPVSPHPSMGSETSISQNSMIPPSTVAASPECSIRFTAMQLEYDGSSYPEQKLTTSMFKNSVWNRAHFGNPDFHPEEWNPEDETAEHRVVHRKRKEKREA